MAAVQQRKPQQPSIDDGTPFDVDAALSRLGDEDRDALVLRFFQEMDYRSVGHALAVSEEAARKRIARALAKLQAILRPAAGPALSVAAVESLLVSALHRAPAHLAQSTIQSMAAGFSTASAGISMLKGVSRAMAFAKSHTTAAALVVLLLLATAWLIAGYRHGQTPGSAANSGASETNGIDPADIISGYVVSPTGQAVAGAKVMASQSDQFIRVVLAHSARAESSRGVARLAGNIAAAAETQPVLMAQTQTDAAGHFELHVAQPPAGIVALAEEGVGFALPHDVGQSHVLALRPFGRMEGEVRVGRGPGAGVKLVALHDGDSDLLNEANVIIVSETTSDASGRFVMERVLPGNTLVVRAMPPAARSPSTGQFPPQTADLDSNQVIYMSDGVIKNVKLYFPLSAEERGR